MKQSFYAVAAVLALCAALSGAQELNKDPGQSVADKASFPLSEDAPRDLTEWSAPDTKIVPGNWKGDGVIVSKVGTDGFSLPESMAEAGDRVLIRTYSPDMFRAGDRLSSYKRGSAAYAAKTGKRIGIKVQRTALLEVVKVSGTKVTAKIMKAQSSVEKGQLVTQ